MLSNPSSYKPTANSILSRFMQRETPKQEMMATLWKTYEFQDVVEDVSGEREDMVQDPAFVAFTRISENLLYEINTLKPEPLQIKFCKNLLGDAEYVLKNRRNKGIIAKINGVQFLYEME